MDSFGVAAWTIAGIVILTVGVFVLRRAWTQRRRATSLVWGGWAIVIAGLAAFDLGWGSERGTTFGLIVLGLAAYAVVAWGVQHRTSRARHARDAALDPEERSPSWGRAIFKSLLAIVLAGIAAMGIGLVIAVAAPMPEFDRIIIGGLLVPLLWGGGMAWTLCDAKLLRAFLVLAGVSVVTYGAVFLPGMLA